MIVNQCRSRWDSAVWVDRVAALEDSFRELSSDPRAFPIGDIGRVLMLMRPVVVPKKHGSTKKSLKKLAGAAAGMAEALAEISPVAAHAMNYKLSQIAMFRFKLQALRESAANAANMAVTRGAPEKKQPRAIAEVVAVHYWAITGKKPTVPKKEGVAYGPFLELMTAIFEILEINASPQSQAEAVSRTWSSSPQKLLGVGYGIK